MRTRVTQESKKHIQYYGVPAYLESVRVRKEPYATAEATPVVDHDAVNIPWPRRRTRLFLRTGCTCCRGRTWQCRHRTYRTPGTEKEARTKEDNSQPQRRHTHQPGTGHKQDASSSLAPYPDVVRAMADSRPYNTTPIYMRSSASSVCHMTHAYAPCRVPGTEGIMQL